VASKKTSNNEIYRVLLDHSDRLGRIEGEVTKINELKETIEKNFKDLKKDLGNLETKVQENSNDIIKIKQTARTITKVGGISGGIISFAYFVFQLLASIGK